MASLPGGSNKDDKGDSRRDRAVSRYLVPILVAWLLAVGGLAGWDSSTSDIVELGGKLAIVASTALAFLTVVLAAVQDMVRVSWKQKLLFPLRPKPFPSHWAFSELLGKANLEPTDLAGLADFRDGIIPSAPADQDRLWYAAFKRHEDELAIAQFSARHIAWRDAVILLIFLFVLTLIIAAVGTWIGNFANPTGWWLLTAACLGLGILCLFAGRGANVGLVIEVLKSLAREPKENTPSLSSDRPSTVSDQP